MRKLIALIALLAASAPAHGLNGGMLKTMPHGRYECALPGDAVGPAWTSVPEESFVLSGASSYRSEAGDGTYILKGRNFTFTRGPFKGRHFRRTGNAELQAIEPEGSLGRMICIRVSSTH